MAAPKDTTDIRTDVSVSIAQNHAIDAVRALHDAMWWDEEVHLDRAQGLLEQALSYTKAARKNVTNRAKK